MEVNGVSLRGAFAETSPLRRGLTPWRLNAFSEPGQILTITPDIVRGPMSAKVTSLTSHAGLQYRY